MEHLLEIKDLKVEFPSKYETRVQNQWSRS